MRSRPELDLYLLPKRPVAGNRMQARAVLTSSSDTPIEGVEFHLEGVERRHSGTSMVGSVPVAKYETVGHVNLFGRTPATTLTEGKHTFSMNFDLPVTAPPHFRSTKTTIEYTLSVRVVIPWWPDRMGRYVVEVGAPLRVASSSPVSFCTHEQGPVGDELYIEASLDRTTLAPGAALTGAASIGNVAHHRIRRVDLSFVAMERVAGARDRGEEVERYTIILRDGAPTDSTPIPFKVRFPAKATPTFRGALAELRWHAEIRVVIAFGSDVSLSIPLDVVEAAPDQVVQDSASRVPPVGKDRRAMVWAAVARKHGLHNDAEEERMTCDMGDGALDITLEPRKEGGLSTVARLRMPPLGIDLSVAEKRWTDLIGRRGLTTGHLKFDERFTSRAREEAQLRSFFNAAICDALLAFERVSLDDGGATFECACAAQSIEELEGVVSRAKATAALLLEATRWVPAPVAMAPMVPGWREFAELVSGRLQIGCMAIRGAMFEHYPFELLTGWTDDGEPGETVARLLVRSLDDERPALEGADAEAASALQSSVNALHIRDDRVEVTLPAPLADPRTLVPQLQLLARVARAVEGKTSQGPYR